MPASRPPKGLAQPTDMREEVQPAASGSFAGLDPATIAAKANQPKATSPKGASSKGTSPKGTSKRRRNDQWRTSPALTAPPSTNDSLQQAQRNASKGKGSNQGTGRVACAAIPLFPLAARLRCEPDLHHEAVVVCEGSGSTSRVIAASRRARRAGVRAGMTLTQARARCPKLIARSRDPECENTAREVLLEIAESFSPRVEEPNMSEEAAAGLDSAMGGLGVGGNFGGGGGFGGFGGIVYLDIDGLDRHYAAQDQQTKAQANGDQTNRMGQQQAAQQQTAQNQTAEYRLGRKLMRQLDEAGLPAKVGIASSKLAARVAAGLARTALPPPDEPGAVISTQAASARIEPMIVDAGCEAEFLAPLPLHRLSPQSETAHTLERWGIERVGDFARLPKTEVRSRLGEIGHRLHLVARGIDPRPLIARTPVHTMREGLSLEWPIANLEPFLFIARAALERLCDRLARRGLGCKRLEMSLQLEPEGFHERSIELPSPTREAKTLLTLVRLDLEAHTPTAPILRFQFTAQPDTPRLAQMSLFGPAALSPDRLATTIARLFAMLGPQRVGSPRPAAGHLPERFALVEYQPPPPPKVRRRIEPGRGLLAVRVLRPPVALEVLTDEPPNLTEADLADADPAEATQEADRTKVTTLRPISEDFEQDTFAKHDSPQAERTSAEQHTTESNGSAEQKAYRAAFDRAEGSGIARGVQKTALSETEGLDRQHGLFRPSQRFSYQPCQIASEEVVDNDGLPTRPPAQGTSQANAWNAQGRKREVRMMRIQGKVRIASGPWELEEKWWLETRTERDYWDVELSDGALYRIYRDRESGQWFADGVYD